MREPFLTSAGLLVEPYSPDHRDEWDDFVERSNNGTIFQLQRFLDYHPEGRWDWRHVLFRDADGRLEAVLPGGIREGGIFFSPTGSSYGSFVTGDISFRRALRLIDAWEEYVRASGIRQVFLIPAPLIYDREYCQHLEYALLFRGYGYELHYISHCIELKRGPEFLQFFDETARRYVRKGWRAGEISIRESDDLESYHPILVRNKLRHDSKPTHSLEDLLRLKRLAPDRLKLVAAYRGETMIGGVLLFLANPKVALCFYISMDYEYEKYHPVYLAMHHVVQWAVDHGYEWVDMGVSQDTASDNPMTPSVNLIDFKERFDARGILRSTYVKSY